MSFVEMSHQGLSPRRGWRGSAMAIFAVTVAVAVRATLLGEVDTHIPYVTFYPAVTIVALYGGVFAGLLATVLSAFLVSLLWIEPARRPFFHNSADWLGMVIFMGSCVAVCLLCEAMHRAQDRARSAMAAKHAQLNNALGQSRERLRMTRALEQAGAGLWILELGTQRIEENAMCAHLFGGPAATPADYKTAANVLEGMDPRDRPGFEEKIRLALKSDGVFDSEFRVQWPDGSQHWLSARGQVVRDPTGKAVQVAGIKFDITDRKRAEEALVSMQISDARARTEAVRSSQAKDRFLATLSHELRNPLAPVLATVVMLQGNAQLDGDTQASLEVIRRNCEMEARLIDDLLDVTRIVRGKVELSRRPVDLGTIIAHAVEVCRPDIEARKLDFAVDLTDGPYVVDADATRLQQVFWNILKNAVKFTPRGGCVGIVCRRAHESDGDGQVIAEVVDSGVGIEPATLPSIFNAFEQGSADTTRQFGGLGLGLTISRAIVELHGGSISAQSEGKDKGAKFTVRLPLAVAGVAAAEQTPATPPRSRVVPPRPLRILLVEDHGDTARIMRRLLMADGHQVETAADVATALQLSGQGGFDLLLSDLGLPDGSGLDLMRTLRQRGMMLPGIAVSGYGQEQDMAQSRAAGFAAHLTKPVSLVQLEDAIAAVSA